MLVINSKDVCPHPSVDLLEFDGVKIGFEKKLKIVGVIYEILQAQLEQYDI